MRNILILFAFCAILPVSPAQAEPKATQWLGWFPSHTEWNEFTRYNPYLENGRHTHPEQFRDDGWTPSVWLQQRGAEELVRGFYRADIIRAQEQDEDDGASITVGPNFYRLGGQDKRRVIASLVAASPVDGGSVTLRDWYTHMPIGLYSAAGLQIQ